MKAEPKRPDPQEILVSSREAAEAAIAAAKNAGISTWEDSAKKVSGTIQQWEDVAPEEAVTKRAA